MNEITNALRVANTAFKTVRIIDILKKIVVTAAVMLCGIFAFRFLRK